jgi:hypothetical protein
VAKSPVVESSERTVREGLVLRVREDLVGPFDIDEIVEERPSDRYLTGILYPPGEGVAVDEDDAPREETGATDTDGEIGEVPIYRSMRPSTFGLSFRVRGDQPEIHVGLSGGRYEALANDSADMIRTSEGQESPNRRPVRRSREFDWHRSGVDAALPIRVVEGFRSYELSASPLSLRCSVRAVSLPERTWGVTVVVSNESASEGAGPTWSEEHSLFQAAISITPGAPTEFVPRPLITALGDDEDKSTALLYRDVKEWAVGHSCGATWTASGNSCDAIATDWLPTALVPSVSAEGSEDFQSWAASDASRASCLATANDEDLLSALESLVNGYRSWLGRLDVAAAVLTDSFEAVGSDHLDRCRNAVTRMENGIAFLRSNSMGRRAFRLANEIMARQRSVQAPGEELRWRPFQLGFQLLSLPSVAQRGHPERSVMDLLWFPTGGGKTEAYLGLIAFVMVYRRLAHPGNDRGAGVAAIMRYTLRVLTTQQFQRAAAMVCAAELIRDREDDLGSAPFSVGLWIGNDAIPNKLAKAREDPSSVKVLTSCPACSGPLVNPTAADLEPRCRNGECAFSSRPLPIHVVDEDIYQVRPSLVIATIDKFAQITREARTQTIFSLDGQHDRPDLILQDELHLISGPLGTLAGVYEIAIDEFCRDASGPAKVIGSTATIRRARDQVRSLFNRRVDLFPPSGLDHADSGFAVVDGDLAGRVYLGITTAGRSPKFTLQAVLSSLLQSTRGLVDAHSLSDIDPYWTCVTYFNSLRELGGAVVLVEDDVRRSIERLAALRREEPRQLDTPSEITSRVPSNEIPDVLERLSEPYPTNEVDVVLASNMISVGVDVPRLGLMVVNGQPKTTAEYIQATSRVGRGQTPGLVVVVYNAQRPRDRSRYESFLTWHGALYRDVEPTSVTPFAARARDRALHAPLVALMRHLHPAPDGGPALGGRIGAARMVAEQILDRVREVDPEVVDDTRLQLAALIDDWAAKEHVTEWWWWAQREAKALMIGAEDYAARAIQARDSEAWPTPNSMREVEPSTRFRFVPGLAARERGT